MARRVHYDREGDAGIITLSDPPLNLFGYELTNELIAALEEAEGDMIRALVIRAEGDVFTGGVDVLRQVLQQLKDRAIPVDDVGLRRPTLDDVFLSLTGHGAEEDTAPGGKRDGVELVDECVVRHPALDQTPLDGGQHHAGPHAVQIGGEVAEHRTGCAREVALRVDIAVVRHEQSIRAKTRDQGSPPGGDDLVSDRPRRVAIAQAGFELSLCKHVRVFCLFLVVGDEGDPLRRAVHGARVVCHVASCLLRSGASAIRYPAWGVILSGGQRCADVCGRRRRRSADSA